MLYSDMDRLRDMFKAIPRIQSNTARAPDYTALYPPHLLDELPDPLGQGQSHSSAPFPFRTWLHVSMIVGKGVSYLEISCQMAIPNSSWLIKSPSTTSCMRSVLKKQIVLRTNRLIRVGRLMRLLLIFWVCAFPTVCCSASRFRS